MADKMNIVRYSKDNTIVIKGHCRGLMGQVQGTIMYTLSMQQIFEKVAKVLNVDVENFYKNGDDAIKMEHNMEDGSFKITIDDSQNITNLADNQSKSTLI